MNTYFGLRMISVFIILFLLSQSVYTQSSSQFGWQWQNQKPTGNSINRVRFADAVTGYAVGDNGTVMKTTDGGNSWYFLNIFQRYPTSDYKALYLFSKDTVIVGCSSGMMFKTKNGGASWDSISVPGLISYCSDITFTSSLTGYMVASNYGVSYKSTNGGYNWTAMNAGDPLGLNSVFFLNSNTGYIAGGKFVKTTNAGTTWDTSSVFALNSAAKVYFINEQTGFLCGNGIFLTTNGGSSWKIHCPDNYMTDLVFPTVYTGWATGYNGVYKSSDGGFTWSNVMNNAWANSINFPNSTVAYMAGSTGTIRKSTNSGANWSPLNTELTANDIYSLFFLNSTTGFMSEEYGAFYKTTNGGTNWNIISNTVSGANCILFFDENTGYTGHGVGYGSGMVRRTTNGGLNWTANVAPRAVYSLFFIDNNTGFGTGNDASVVKTTNSGQDWFYVYSANGWTNSVFFVDQMTGYAVGETSPDSHGFILKSTDGGNNWSTQIFDFWGPSPNSVWFTDHNTGYFAGGSIFKTTNAGVNWFGIYGQFGMSQIKFFNANTGIACGDHGSVIKTTNGGLNWSSFYSVTDFPLWGMYFVDPNTGWVSGQFGILLKLTDGSLLLNEQNRQSGVPEVFTLYQNFPNPFNPATKIKFDIPNVKSAQVVTKLVIYDMLGRKIATLINELLNPGTYEVNWNASNYPSGVYFYQLSISNDQLATKKMVLIK